jgi:hypothetical protein
MKKEPNGRAPVERDVRLLPCPFCGEIPELPRGDGTQYEIECNCGMARSCIQISDLMSIDERASDPFENYLYSEIYIQRAKNEAIKAWNTRTPNRYWRDKHMRD